MNNDVEVRRTTPADRPAVLSLLADSLGWERDAAFAEFFDWKHAQNPFGPSPAWVARIGDETVGFRTFLRWRFEHPDGRVRNAVRAVDTATAPAHQGRGIFRLLTTTAVEAMTADGVDFVFNTPNASSRPGYLRMGWSTVGRLPLVARVRGIPSALRMRTRGLPPDGGRSRLRPAPTLRPCSPARAWAACSNPSRPRPGCARIAVPNTSAGVMGSPRSATARSRSTTTRRRGSSCSACAAGVTRSKPGSPKCSCRTRRRPQLGGCCEKSRAADPRRLRRACGPRDAACGLRAVSTPGPDPHVAAPERTDRPAGARRPRSFPRRRGAPVKERTPGNATARLRRAARPVRDRVASLRTHRTTTAVLAAGEPGASASRSRRKAGAADRTGTRNGRGCSRRSRRSPQPARPNAALWSCAWPTATRGSRRRPSTATPSWCASCSNRPQPSNRSGSLVSRPPSTARRWWPRCRSSCTRSVPRRGRRRTTVACGRVASRPPSTRDAPVLRAGDAGTPAIDWVGTGPAPVAGGTAACLLVNRRAYEPPVAASPDDPVGAHGPDELGAGDLDTAAFELTRRLTAGGGRIVVVPDAVVVDHRPALSRRALTTPVSTRTPAWRTYVEAHGPELLHAAAPLPEGALRIAITVAAPSEKVAPRGATGTSRMHSPRSLRGDGHTVRVQTLDHADDLRGRARPTCTVSCAASHPYAALPDRRTCSG